MFKDWRTCSQESISLDLQYNGLYYIHAQAWHIKGYLGGKHSWCTFNMPTRGWVVVELTTRETLYYQDCDIIYDGGVGLPDDAHAPFISTRAPNKQWFGHDPEVVKIYPYRVEYADVEAACKSYPFKEFNLLTKNCNTFTSYLMHELQIEVRRLIHPIGWKSDKFWDVQQRNNVV